MNIATKFVTSLLVLVLFSLSSAGQDVVKSPEGIITELFGFNVSDLTLKNSAEGLVLDYVWDIQQIPNAFPNPDRSTIELSIYGLQVFNEPDQPTSFNINGPQFISQVENFTISGRREVVVGSCNDFFVDNGFFELAIEVSPVGTKGQDQIDGPIKKFSFPLTKIRSDEDCALPENGRRDVLTQAAALTPIPQGASLSVDNISLEIIDAAFTDFRSVVNRSIGFLNFDFLLVPDQGISIESISGFFDAVDQNTSDSVNLLSLNFERGLFRDDQGNIKTVNQRFAVTDSNGRQTEFCKFAFDKLQDPQLEISLDLQAVQTLQTVNGPQYRILLPALVARQAWDIIGACPNAM